MRVVWCGLLVAALGSGACKGPAEGDPAGEVLAEDVTAAGPAEGGAAPVGPLVDLLYETRSRVSVSSRVDNAADTPDHLVDRRPDTAWQSRTGDLSPTIGFEVAPEARVRELSLTVGYDRATDKGDLFHMNHRVRRVALEREGSLIGSYELDPETRAPQVIRLDVAGGSFVLRVVDVVPGTARSFREVAISELAVLGTATAAARVPAAAPHVAVGRHEPDGAGLRSFRDVFDAAPFATAEALCARHTAISAAQIDAAKARDPHDHFVGELVARCAAARPPGVQEALPPPYEVRVIGVVEDLAFVDRVIVRTEAGWFPTGVLLDRSELGPGCGQAGVTRLEQTSLVGRDGEPPVVVFQYATRRAEWLRLDRPPWEAAARFRVACTPRGRAMACSRVTVAASTEDFDWVNQLHAGGPADPVPPRWQWEREAIPQSGGSFRLGPCQDPSGAVARCDRAAERVLTSF